MDNLNSQQTPNMPPEQAIQLIQSLIGAPQSSQGPQGAPLPPQFASMGIGQLPGGPTPPPTIPQPPSGDFIQQRGKIGPSSNPLLRLLGAATGRGSFDYTNEAAPANQAGISDAMTKLFGVPGPATASRDANGNPVVTAQDLAPQAALGTTIAQNRMGMMQMMANFVDPTSAIHILGPEKATPLIQASMQRGYGGMIPKETFQAAQTAGAQELTGKQQQIEKDKTIASETGKIGESQKKLKGLLTMVDQLEPLVKAHKPIPFLGELMAKGVSASGGFGTPSMKLGAQIENLAIPLSAAMNYELTKRFNGEEAGLMKTSLTPSAKDTPEFGLKKLQLTRTLLKAMEQGDDQSLQNVAEAVTGKPVHLISTSDAHSLSQGMVVKGYRYMGGPASDPKSWQKVSDKGGK